MQKLIFAAFLAGVFLTTAVDAVTPVMKDGPGPNLVIQVGDAAGTPKGTFTVTLYDDKAPNHVARIVELAKSGEYDGVVVHRVIDGFMAQTGDVQYGKAGGDTGMAGMGGSGLPDLKAEFSQVTFREGTVGMARGQSPDSANSQFFIDLAPAEFLNGQYTAVGQVIDGMDVVKAIKKGDRGANGTVSDPDQMLKVTVQE